MTYEQSVYRGLAGGRGRRDEAYLFVGAPRTSPSHNRVAPHAQTKLRIKRKGAFGASDAADRHCHPRDVNG